MRALSLILIVLMLPLSAVAAEPVPLVEWCAYGGGPLPATWSIEGGTIHHVPGGGDIESAGRYADFELDFDWQISPGGNSGVFYRVPEGTGGTSLNGPEYQILDNGGHPDGKAPITSAASAYAVYPPSRDVTRPVGEWNSGRIVVRGRHVEHWLNGVEVLSYELGSPDWQARVAASKFRGSAYGTAPRGYIVLQDHGAAVAYRNVTITTLP
jgi:hypothetical protein